MTPYLILAVGTAGLVGAWCLPRLDDVAKVTLAAFVLIAVGLTLLWLA